MINTRIVGAYISQLRKEKNLTQAELAEQLNISHQAVSKWENGIALPDTETLLLLARIFHVSVEEILSGGKTRPVQRRDEARLSEPEAELSGDGENISDLESEEVFMLKNAIENKTNDGIENGIKIPNLAAIKSLIQTRIKEKNKVEAELQSKEDIREPIRSAHTPSISHEQKNGEETKEAEAIEGFQDQTQAEKEGRKMKINTEYLAQLAPFLSKEALHRAFNSIVEGEIDAKYLSHLAPFLDKKTLDQAFDMMKEGTLNIKYLGEMAPFMSKETLDKAFNMISEGEISLNHLAELAPFLSQENLDKAFDMITEGQISADHLIHLAPFLRRETLLKAVTMIQEGTMRPDHLVALAPFLDKDTLEALLFSEEE
jgi:transcriptional regulator with XRE-family HTH domain